MMIQPLSPVRSRRMTEQLLIRSMGKHGRRTETIILSRFLKVSVQGSHLALPKRCETLLSLLMRLPWNRLEREKDILRRFCNIDISPSALAGLCHLLRVSSNVSAGTIRGREVSLLSQRNEKVLNGNIASAVMVRNPNFPVAFILPLRTFILLSPRPEVQR